MTNPRSITDAERPWLEAWSLETQLQLIRELRRHGRTRAFAHALVGWLTEKTAGVDEVAAGSRSVYRRVLSELAADGVAPTPVTGRRGGSSRQAGYAELGLVGAVAGAAALVCLPAPYAWALATIAENVRADELCQVELVELAA